MFVRVSLSLTAASLLMMALTVSTPLAGASECSPPVTIMPAHTSVPLDRAPASVVAQAAPSDDSADSDSDSDSNDSASDNQNGGNDQGADSDQMEQQSAGNQQAVPDPNAGEADQLPLNSYPGQVNPNQ